MLKLVVLLLAGAIGFACSFEYLIWIPRSASADPLYRFVVDGKAGYIDRKGKVLIEPRLDYFGNSGGEFHEGFLRNHSKDGSYLNVSGEVVIGKGLASGREFSEGLAIARKEATDLWGYVDRTGEFVIQPRSGVSPSSFSQGLAQQVIDDKVGYIGKDGLFAIAPQFAHGSDFHDGMARVIVKGQCLRFKESPCPSLGLVGKRKGAELTMCKYDYVDKTGRVVTNGQFGGGRDFSEGLAAVRIDDLWGFINKSGAIAIEPQYEEAWSTSDGLARIVKNGLYGFINRSGHIVIAPQFSDAEDFHEGLAVVQVGESRFRYIDKNGKFVLGDEYEAASPFFKGLAHVKQGKKFSYIDTTGKVVFQY